MVRHNVGARFVAVIFITTLIASGVVNNHLTPAASAAASWLSGWNYRSPVTIQNTGAVALSNYQVKITLPANGFDYTKAQASGADLRLTDSDGLTPLHYWTEQFSPASHTGIIWTSVPYLAAGGSSTIYVYYGNPSAVSQSNGASVFPVFSNFNNPAWQKLPNMPITTADETVAQVNGIFYILAGYNNGAADPLGINYAFNPTTNTYSQKASMPTLRWGPISASVGSNIYVFGGKNNSGPSTANEMYNTLTNTWTRRASLPAAISNQGLTGCSDGTNIYLEYNSLLYVYNPLTDTYTQKASLPQSILSWATCAYSSGNIYIVNGYQNGARNYVQIYNIATNTWSQGAPSPFATYGSIRESPVIGNSIYLIQGQQTNAEFQSAAYEYNMTTNTWKERSFGPHAADGVAGGVYNGKIYTFGGRQDWTGPYGLPFASSYDPAADSDQNWYQMYGNFEADSTGLHRMVPLKGSISNGPSQSQISTYYQTGSSFVVEAQTNQIASSSWSSIGVNANVGYYNKNMTGYHVAYNDQGLTPKVTSFYKETGTQFTKLATSSPMAYGAQRFVTVSTPSVLAIYRNGALLASTGDTTYRGGHVDLLANIGNNSTVNYLFVRQYAAVNPTVSVGYLQTNPASYATCPCSLWPASAGPASDASNNPYEYELGSRFYSEVPATVTALRFYKEPGMAASHTGHLWDTQGHLLASANFSNETASGWQQVALASPVTLAANTPYIVSYHITGGPFAYTQSQFANQILGTPPLHAFEDGMAGPNGVSASGPVAFPQNTWSSTNYWADVVVTTP